MTDLIDICGIAELPQGKTDWPSPMAYHETLVRNALADAQLKLSDVDALFTVEPRSDAYLVHAIALAERLRITPEFCWSYTSGGCVPITMLQAAHALIESGRAETAVIIAADLPLTSVSRDKYVANLAQVGPIHPEFEAPYGPPVPAMFSLVASAYLDATGQDDRALMQVALHDRAMAERHPNAHLRKPMSPDDYLASRAIATPLRLLDCAPVSNGGGAVVLSRRKKSGGVPIRLRGVGASTSQMHLSAAASLTEFSAGDSLKRALDQAGMKIADLDLFTIYDCFTIAMLVNAEDMGIAPRGQLAAAFADGRCGPGGTTPINPHGGLLSHGHPARAGGMGNLIETIVQLRGEAGARQVPDCAIGMAHGMAGVFASHATGILARGDA